MDNRERRLIEIAAEAQARIVEAITRLSAGELAGSAFDQTGLSNGREVVEDYLRHGEIGVAFEHVCYMLVETGVGLTAESAHSFVELAAELGLRAPILQVTPRP